MCVLQRKNGLLLLYIYNGKVIFAMNNIKQEFGKFLATKH